MAGVPEHLLKVCDGILAGVYGVELDPVRHEKLLTELKSAVDGARSTPKIEGQDELIAALEKIPEEERAALLARVVGK